MHYRTILTLALFSVTTASHAVSLCQEKEQEIQREIHYAEKQDRKSVV